jgi:uncharacterized protein (TIGR01777 family)
MKRIIIAGGAGFIGRALAKEAALRGWEAVALTRGSGRVDGARMAQWDGRTAGSWTEELEGAEAVVNLAGAPILKRLTPEYEKVLRSSRVDPTRAIGAALRACASPPAAWVNGSAVGFYGDAGPAELDESSPPGRDPIARICVDWEAACTDFQSADTAQTRLRIGIVLGKGGGAFEELSKPVKMLAGSPLGSGGQYMSWIHMDDLVRMIFWAIDRQHEGSLNATSPAPVTNREMMSALRHAYRAPTVAPPLPSFAAPFLSRITGLNFELLLTGQRVLPKAALEGGFEFKFTELSAALADLVGAA